MDATRWTHDRHEGEVWKGLVAGTLGGLAASWVMNQFQALKPADTLARLLGEEQQSDEESGDDATVKAASAISRGVFGHTLTKREKKVAGPAVHYGFGATVGAAYGALAEVTPAVRVGMGLPFGAAVWLASDEAAVPALGLSEAPTEYPASVHLSAFASHLVYGLTTDLVRRAVRAAL